MRHLRNYQRVANKEHWCDRCCNHIQPGEMYEADVLLYEDRKKYRLIVKKTHVYPTCDFPEDPPDEIESKIEKTVKQAA